MSDLGPGVLWAWWVRWYGLFIPLGVLGLLIVYLFFAGYFLTDGGTDEP